LRLQFQRRPCREINLPECDEPDPPHADFPHNWGGYTDVIHVDFKIPSEHLIYGERFDAEMQIFHLHPSRRRTPTVVALMKACTTCHNDYLQDVIDEFQITFDNHTAECATRMRRDRKLMSKAHTRFGKNVESSVDHDTSWKFSTSHEAPTHPQRKLQQIFNPHHEKLVPSIHFFGYEGSLTEPPCSEFVTWFITDVPMEISFDQLEQLKRIQFNHVDPHCKKTSIHSKESNARPIQDTFGRPVWRCTPSDFVADDFSSELDGS
jgi:carbonic anhydrase